MMCAQGEIKMCKANKLYIYKTWIFLMLLCLCGIFAPIIGIVLLWQDIFYRVTFIVISCFFVLVLIYSVIVGIFTPIRISDSGIKYRKMNLNWDEVKVTAYPQLNKSFRYGYYLILDNCYIDDLKNIRKKLFTGCRVYMDKKVLSVLLPYCKNKILILNPFATKESLPNSNLKCNKALIDFNQKIDKAHK